MTEWWNSPSVAKLGQAELVLLQRILVALVLGFVVSRVYRRARRGEAVSATFVNTLILLAPLIAMATQIIGDNIARAFSLVGALSVVRFRTVVKDTQDTAFVIFAVVVGMAAGANHLDVALIGLGLLATAGLVLWPKGGAGAVLGVEGLLTVRMVASVGSVEVLETHLAAAVDRAVQVSAGTVKQGTLLEVVYSVRLRPGATPADLVASVTGLAGTESVELRRDI